MSAEDDPGPVGEAGTATGNVSILEFRARVEGPPALVAALEDLFSDGPAWAAHRVAAASPIMVRVRDVPGRQGWQEVLRDGVRVWATDDGAAVLPYVEWLIYSAAAECVSGRCLLFHAGTVALDGRGIVMPAASGSGKTTLTAALVASGFEYLSDEVAAIDATTLTLVPFPRTMRVKIGSRHVLAPYFPELLEQSARPRFDNVPVWYVHPPAEAWPSGPVPVSYVVLPRYVPGSRTSLARVERSVGLQQLVEQFFRGHQHGAAGIAAVTRVVQSADCYELTYDDLGSAVETLSKLVRAAEA